MVWQFSAMEGVVISVPLSFWHLFGEQQIKFHNAVSVVYMCLIPSLVFADWTQASWHLWQWQWTKTEWGACCSRCNCTPGLFPSRCCSSIETHTYNLTAHPPGIKLNNGALQTSLNWNLSFHIPIASTNQWQHPLKCKHAFFAALQTNSSGSFPSQGTTSPINLLNFIVW